MDVIAVSGHMIDTPDRPRPRFPPDQIPRVADEIRAALDAWDVGPGTTVVSGGARGADLLVSEQALERGARIRLCLALPADEFEQRSVALPGTDWGSRFRRALGHAEVEIVGSPEQGDDAFVRANMRIVEVARTLASGTPRAIVVWDGRAGDGPGGTRDFVERLGYDRPDEAIRVIDPTRRVYEARQTADGPKKLLALDGGGVPSVGILAALEAKLRERHDPGLVLADCFDYIAGASTGAPIAAALALGKPVAEIREGALGAERTLGDPELRSLLLIVTDAARPLSNCTNATYNRAERNLVRPSDRTLDLPLGALLRGSAAAPVHFLPVLLFLMATLPEYGLGWPVGERELLLVSVATGASAAVEDLLCRSLGRTRAGAAIDLQFGARHDVTSVAGRNLFTYLRYDPDTAIDLESHFAGFLPA